MAALCDIFVHDAFGTAHRAEASTYGIAQFAPVACAGPLLAAEIDAITKALAQPKRPLLAIVAGSKVSTKLSILQSLAKNVDGLIVGGGIANTFLLAEGLPIGKSLAEAGTGGRGQGSDRGDEGARRGGADPGGRGHGQGVQGRRPASVKAVADVAADDLILDIGPQTAAMLAGAAQGGRHHRLERAGGRVRVRRLRARHREPWPAPSPTAAPSASPAAATRWRPSPSTASRGDVGYISTGGGAFLEVLEGKTLPAFEILGRRAAG